MRPQAPRFAAGCMVSIWFIWKGLGCIRVAIREVKMEIPVRSTTQGRFSMSKVWLVTGSASGLGRNIAEAVLASGDRLIATARDPRRLEDLVNKFGERVRAVSLDVANESAAQGAVRVVRHCDARSPEAVPRSRSTTR